MGEESTSASLPRRAYSHFREHGVRSLVRTSTHYFSKQFIRNRALSTDDLEALARSRGTIWYADDEAPIEIPLPEHQQLRTAFSDYPRTYRPRQAFVCELPDCHLIEQAAALYNGERLLLDTTRNHLSSNYLGSERRIATHALKSRLGMNPEWVDECLFSLLCMDPSYYHWLLEFLPKLRLLELYRNKTGRTPTPVINPNPADFVVETLELAGYGPEQCLEWDRTPRVVTQLVVAPHRPHRFDYQNLTKSDYRPSRADFEWLRSRIRSRIPTESVDAEANRRIFISRQSADRGRQVVNYEEILPVLEAYGFESHVLENYPFEKQMRLFIEADVIAGSHGAGLANMLFADDPLVVELFPKTLLKPHFYFLASIMGFEYEAIVTDAAGDDLYVDTDQLHQRLDEINL